MRVLPNAALVPVVSAKLASLPQGSGSRARPGHIRPRDRSEVSVYPDELKYTSEHEWVRPLVEGTVRLGITHYAQEALGDIVYVSLPETGQEIAADQVIGEVESTKSVSEVYAPFAGTVSARNEELDQQPDLVNSDPYGDGWMVEIRVQDASALDFLMDAGSYQELVERE